MTRRTIFLPLFLFIFSSVTFSQSRLYVAADATGTANGTSWTNAFTSLNAAFATYQSGDTIWVKNGTYKPVGGTNADFQPPNGSVLYGGFAGTETSISDRVAGAMSNLDGDIGTNGVSSDNCRRVLYFSNNTSEIVLDGFRIRNGYAYTIGGSITVGGGGARISQGRVKFENCEFSDNYTYMRGGAMAIYGSSSRVKLINCTFKNNLANTSTSSAMGGAIFCNAGILTIEGCDFRSNTARRGGAMSGFQPTITIDRTTFSGNEATSNYGGAIDNGSESSLTVYNSLFVGNVASTSGAAIYTSTTLNTRLQKYVNCTFAHNYNGSLSNSYAVYASDLTSVSNCILWGNRGFKQLFNLPPAINPVIRNCILEDDTISNGVNMFYGDPLFVNPGVASSTPFELGTYNYKVNATSEAVNNGDVDRTNPNYPLDLEGNARKIGSSVDIGAYESPYITYMITLGANIDGVSTQSGAGQYFKDSFATISTSRADDCYRFVRWEDAGVGVSNFQTFNVKVTFNRTFTAIWERKTTSATFTSEPTNGGRVEGGGVFDCDLDSLRTFTAIPAPCYKFVNWTINGGVVATNAVYSARLSGDVEIVANFAYADYEVTATTNIDGAGAITGTGIYTCDSTATLTATTDDCYTFVNWTEDGVVLSTDTFYTFNVNSDRAVVANYKAKQYAINVVVDPVLGGEVSGDGPADCGSTVTLEATRKSNYIFTGWEENGATFSTNETYTFTANEDRNLKANFSFTGSVPSAASMGIHVYPNPARTTIVVNTTRTALKALEIYDVRGHMIDHTELNALSYTIDVSNFATGLYYLKIYTKSGVVQQRVRVE